MDELHTSLALASCFAFFLLEMLSTLEDLAAGDAEVEGDLRILLGFNDHTAGEILKRDWT